MTEPTYEQIDCVARSIVNDTDFWRAMDELERTYYRHAARRYILAYLNCPPPYDAASDTSRVSASRGYRWS
jgi:hypothetical protein